MEYYDKLRYRLMPYIYTLGADTYFKDGTIMRGLVMDFAADKRSWGIDDEYLFGPAFLVAPVTEYKARERKVYLPGGRELVRFLHRPQHARRADDHRRRAVRAHAFVRPRRLDRPDRPGDPVHRQQLALAADAQRLHRRRTAASRSTRTTGSAASISTANIRASR